MHSSDQRSTKTRARGRYGRSRFAGLKKWLAGGAAASLVASLVVFAGFQAQQAIADEVKVTTEMSTESPVLAGEEATVILTIANDSAEEWYNGAFVLDLPIGVSAADSAILGSLPTSLESESDNDVPSGYVRWIWEDVSDLPIGASFTVEVELTVDQPAMGAGETSDTDVFPVGSDFDVHFNAYASNDANILPWFDGSSARSQSASEGVTRSSDPLVESTDVEAIRVTKTHNQPESELLRGVQEHHATYTLTIENTSEGATNVVEVVDYLHAGLEFLGDASVDNSSAEEYNGAGEIAGEAPAGYVAPSRVETVELGVDEVTGLEAGVYTKVTWLLDLAAGETQTLPYLVGIPLFENTMWDGDAPEATSLAQSANLDNNTGASTRHGETSPNHIDANVYDNTVFAEGTYQGVIRAGTDRSTSDSDSEDIFGVDVRVLKAVTTDPDEVQNGDAVPFGAGDHSFRADKIAKYTLHVDTSQYTSSSESYTFNDEAYTGTLVIDVIEDGLCSLVPEDTPVLTGPVDIANPFGPEISFTGAELADFPVNCEPGSSKLPSTWGVSGADLIGVAYDAASNNFYTFFNVPPMSANASVDIVYPAYMRPSYSNEGWGQTTSTDRLFNNVMVKTTTTPVDGVPGGQITVAENSEASLTSGPATISKKVLQRDAFGAGTDPASPCIVTDPSLYEEELATGFLFGDRVCFELTVNFPGQADTRNPKITDMLPYGIETAADQVVAFLDGEQIHAEDIAVNSSGSRFVVTPHSNEHTPVADRFVTAGSILKIYVWGTVTVPSSEFGNLDKPENLMKFQQSNVHEEIFFDRDQAGIEVLSGLQLLKGVAKVDAEAVTGAGNCDGTEPDCDHVQVTETDVVTYRVDLFGGENETGDLIGVPYATSNIQVWDVIPDAFRDAPISAGEGAGTFKVIRHDDNASRPVGAPAGKTLVVWDGVNVAANATHTLTYDVTVPSPTLVGSQHENSAAIVEYETTPNFTTEPGEDSVTEIRPDNGMRTVSEDSELAPNVPGAGTSDVSDVYLENVDIEKILVSSEISGTESDTADTNNPNGSIVQGELATFKYSVTVPANTSVADGVLKDTGFADLKTDDLPFGYNLVSATSNHEAVAPAGTHADFDFDADTGTLTFPEVYTNASDENQVFSVTITVWVTDADATDPEYTPNISHGTSLENVAEFTHTPQSGTPTTIDDEANVTYIEPNLRISKTASAENAVGDNVPTDAVGVGDTITYTIEVSNPGSRPISYDNVVVDTVPAGLIVDPEQDLLEDATITEADKTSLAAGFGGTITWSHEAISALKKITDSDDVELSYVATIHPTTGGGQQYENTAKVTGYTLPGTLPNAPDERRGDRVSADTETITATTAAISKGVRIGANEDYTEEVSAPIGQTVEYEVLVTLHPNINYYDPIITDSMQPGMVLVTDSIEGPTVVDVNREPLDPADVNVNGTWTKGVSGNAHTWTYNGDIEDASATRYLLMTYQVELSDAVPFDVNALPNVVDFSWNSVDDDESTRVPDIKDNANVEVLNPHIITAKSVSNGTPNPGDTFTYSVTFTNNGDTPAYNMTFVDTIPENVIVSGTSITGDGELDGTDDARGGSGGKITWTPEGPLSNVAPNNSVTYEYDATLVASERIRDDEPVADLTNTVIVDRYESFPEGGRDYEPNGEEPGTSDTAVVDPPFPHVVPSKEVTTTDIAYEGVPLSWTLKFENTGDGPALDVSAEDELPVNWNYEDGSAQIRWNGSSTWTDLNDPQISESVTGDNFQETLTWDKAEIRSKSAFPSELNRPILASYSGTGTAPYFEIRFNAIPTSAALTAAGVTEDNGTRVPHVNTVTAIAEDTSGKTGNGSRPSYAPGEGEDEAYIHAVDLHLEKEAIGGTAADASGDWIAGQAAGAGYTQPQWKVTITNQGPDAALGQFRVIDTITQPEGVQTGPFSARYFANASDTVGTPITLSGAGTTAEPYLIGSNETSLQPDGSDRIELVANVTIAADASGTTTNEADVIGRTYEPPAKIEDGTNEDEANKTLTTLADLTINKAVNTVSPRAGENITWQLDVRNLGPSVSVSSDDTPITVKDTVPTGVTVTQNPSTTLWTATVDGAAFPAEGVTGGTEIVWVYQGNEMPVNVPSSILLTGMIDPAWEPNTELTNEAQVVPGETDDPNFGTPESNNEDTVTVTPGTTTSLGIAKTRVVQQGSGWTNAVDLDPVPPIVPGESVSYRIDVVNNGPAVARNVTVVDESPDGFTYTGIQSIPGSTWNWLDTGAAPTENQTFVLSGNQAVGPTNMKSFVITFDTDEALDVSEPVVNTAIADADNSTNQPEDDDSSNSERNGNLFIEKTHSGNAIAGSTLPYTITVTNEGPSVSGGPIEVTDTLPGGFSFVTDTATASIAGGAAQALDTTLTVLDDGRQHLEWTIGDAESSLAVGATIVITFTSAIDPTLGAQTGLINYATVDGPDNNDPSDDRDEDPTDVETSANMSITKLVEDGPWVAGTEVEYLLTVRNEGPSALDATVTDVLPAGLNAVSMEGIGAGNAWDCSATSCLWETYPVGSSQILVTAFIESGVEQGTDLLNTATVNWEDSDGPHEDSDDEEINVSIIADLGLKKHVLATPSSTEWLDANGADDAGSAVAGEGTSFKLTVSNEGPSDAIAPLVVTDTLPQGVAFDTITVGEGWEAAYDVDTNVVTFTNESSGIAYGADPFEIEYSVTLAPEMEVGLVTNEAEITSETLETNNDGNPDNDADPANVDVQREVDVAIVKTHNEDAVRIWDELPFALEVTNNGPSNASGVTVTDTVPAGLEVLFYAEDLPIDQENGWTIEDVIEEEDGTTTVIARYADELAPGETAPILTIDTLVTPVAYETVTNIAVVDTTEPDRVPENNTTEDPVIVPPMVELVIEKTAVGAFKVGEVGTYRITLTNNGPTEDPGPVVVTDVLPEGLTFASSPDDNVDVDRNTVTWTLENGIQVDEEIVLTLNVNVHQGAYPSVTNVVSVDSPAEKTPESILSDPETVEVAEADPLAVTGAEATMIALAIMLLLLAGGTAVMLSRRKKALAAGDDTE